MLVLVSMLLFCAVTTGAVIDPLAKKITINEINEFAGTDEVTTLKTRCDSVGQFIKEKSIMLGAYDTMSVKEINALEDGMTITLKRGVPVTVETADGIKVCGVTSEDADEAAAELGYTDGEYEVTSSVGDEVREGSVLKIVKVTYEDVVFEENIPFNEEIIYDDTMLLGQTKIVEPGEYGILEKVYNVRYLDGVEDYGVLKEERVAREPKTQVVAHGTQEKAVEVKATKGIAAGGLASRGVMRYKTKLTMNATAYDTSLGQNGGHTRTAIGLVPNLGVVAVDPRVIPLGSRLYIESTDGGNSWVYGYAIAGDTGGAIKGNRIDLCYPTNRQCIAFGRRQATVYVLE